MPTYTATRQDEGKRLDIVLSATLECSRGRIQALIKEGGVRRDDEVLKPNTRIQAGDIFDYVLPSVPKSKEKKVVPPLSVVYEDETLLVVNKPAGLLVHPTREHSDEVTLVDAVVKHDPEIKKVGENPLRPGIMHRLDKDVSGLLAIAKTQKMFLHLKYQFANRHVKKEYVALAYGTLPKDHDVIRLKIARSKSRGRMVARPESQEGKEAITEYDVLERFKTTTLARIRTLTGRTHQIRVHFKGIDHPLVGDPLYAKRHMRHIKPIPFPRVFLHAERLTLPLPDGTIKSFEAPIPGELTKLLKTLTK